MFTPAVALGSEPGILGISRKAMLIGVAVVLALEIGLFCWSFGKFFGGDSLFYLWYRVETPSQIWRILTQTDRLHSYRPLTYIFFSLVLFPLLELSVFGYHVVTLGVHLLVSVLFFRLARELMRTPAAALAGMLWFGVHSVHFYSTYDISFLPDFMHGLFCMLALLCYAVYRRVGSRTWLVAALASFVLALLSKESSVVLPVGVAVIELLRRQAGRSEQPPHQYPAAVWRQAAVSVLPFFAIAALYVGWTLYLRDGRIYPSGSATEPYALTLRPQVLLLKLRYLAWFANLPTMFNRRGWFPYAAIVAMLPTFTWLLFLLVQTARRIWRELLACAAWAFAGLLPVLFITQMPMKHNLYMPVAAVAMAVALLFDDVQSKPGRMSSAVLRGGWAVASAGLVSGTAFLLPGELKYSWVGQASDIALNSLNTVKRAYPTLPSNSVLFVLPTQVRGVTAWYFQQGALFNLFYRDRSLRTRFADDGAALPADFAYRSDIFIFWLQDGKLWDATRQYKRDAQDKSSYRLIEQFPRAGVQSARGRDPGDVKVVVRPLEKNGQCRDAIVMVPGTAVTFQLPPVPPEAVLQLGAAILGPLKSGTRGRIWFEGPRSRRLLASITLDASDGGYWWDRDIDLSALAGRQGTLRIETITDSSAEWMAWSRMRIIQRSNRFFPELAKETDQRLPSRSLRLLDRFEDAEISFDRTEASPNDSPFETPDGKPAFLFAAHQLHHGGEGHLAMVTIVGASVRFPLDPVPPASGLEVAVMNLSALGGGVRARILVDHAGREKIFDDLLPPKSGKWIVNNFSLEKWAGRRVDLIFEASSGLRRRMMGDGCAWGRLRIVSRRYSYVAEAVSQPDSGFPADKPSSTVIDRQSERRDAGGEIKLSPGRGKKGVGPPPI